jgi:hypothetical protein
MNIILAIMLSANIGTAEAHQKHVNKRHGHHVRHHSHVRPNPPPRVRPGSRVILYKNHWTYPHSNSSYMWRWTPGHYNRRGNWVPGHWRVVLRF